MRLSRIFSQTLRDTPNEVETVSHQLLLRAGFIRQLTAGMFSCLPLARRTLDKIERIIRTEIDAIGGQEITMSMVHPAQIWEKSRRLNVTDEEVGRFMDRNGIDIIMAKTHEEIISDLARREIRSYRQLPQLVYRLQTKWWEDQRPRAGLIRAREFRIKNSYSFDQDLNGLESQYQAHYPAYVRIFARCSLPVIAVKGDVGMMGGKAAHDFLFRTPIGDDELLLCSSCGYRANRRAALFRKVPQPKTDALPLEKVATPDCKSIEDLANFLGVPKFSTAKAVFMTASVPDGDGHLERMVFAVIRGDMEVNETKLANAVGARWMRPATEDEIRAVGAIPGYASPIGLRDTLIIVDDLIPNSTNLVAGANELGYHLRNVNYGRDFTATKVVDIAAAQQGDACPQCGSPLMLEHGVKVGNLLKLGTCLSEASGCSFLDPQGLSQPVVMGCYEIWIGRLMACVAELHNDEHGLIWPISIAPYQVHLVGLIGKGDPSTAEQAEWLYGELQRNGIEVLYDDRLESPGVKFNDADLIGLPIRVTVSARAAKAGGVEFKRRDLAEREVIPFDQVITRLQGEIKSLTDQIELSISETIDKAGSLSHDDPVLM